MSQSVTVMIGLTQGLDEQTRAGINETIGKISGVFYAAAINPDAKSDLTKSMYFAELEENADAESVVQQIKAVTGVETAELPAPRYLIQ